MGKKKYEEDMKKWKKDKETWANDNKHYNADAEGERVDDPLSELPEDVRDRISKYIMQAKEQQSDANAAQQDEITTLRDEMENMWKNHNEFKKQEDVTQGAGSASKWSWRS